ncbi:MAG: hypothetical protein WKG52_14395 [Variovorax sp.]
MDFENTPRAQWSSRALLDLLRASLPPAARGRLRTPPEISPAPLRLNSQQLFEVAGEWRSRAEAGDAGAESVAAALELVATRRSQAKRTRIEAVGKRLSQLMQLS